MSIQTEFDKELEGFAETYCDSSVNRDDFVDAIKTAVDKYVIREDILPTNERSVNWTDNNLKAEMRLALWGDK